MNSTEFPEPSSFPPGQPASAGSRRRFLQQLSVAGLLASGATGLAAPATAKGAMLEPFSIPPTAPLDPGPAGQNIRTLVRSSQTNLQFSCVETAVAPRKMGPAPHVHQELDELMYVLEGTATVWMDGQTQEIATGGWHFRPHRIPHTFWNASDRPLRFVDMYFNQNFEDFLEELFHHIMADMAKNHLTPADPGIAKRVGDLCSRFGVVMFPEQRQPLVDRYGLLA